MARNDSVWARSQRNGGFLTGPNHPVLGTEDQMARMKGKLAQAVQRHQASGDPDANAESDDSDPSVRNPDMPVKDEEEDEVIGGGEEAAPNYRPAEAMSDCSGCMHFDKGEGECERYEFAAKPDHVCDDFKPEGDEENEDFASGDSVSPQSVQPVGPASF